jgi:hypothetical protein
VNTTEEFDMTEEHDPLERLSKANPVTGDVTPNQFALERMIRNATATPTGVWTRARYAVTATTSALGSGALVLALIFGLSSAAPELPVLALGGSGAAKMSASADAIATSTTIPARVGGMAIYHPNYTFVVSPDLIVNGDTLSSYQLTSTKSLKSVAEDLANVLGVSGDPVDDNGNWTVTGADGAQLYVGQYGGMINWSYSASQTVSPPSVAATERIAALPAPSNAEARAKAQALFAATGYFGDLGAFEASRYDQFVSVTAPLLVSGVETDQSVSATYDDAQLTYANGVLADLGSTVAYPTISATDAITQLQDTWNPAPVTPEPTIVPDTSGTVDATSGSTGGATTDVAPSAPTLTPTDGATAPTVTSSSGDVATGGPDTTVPTDSAPTYTTVPPQTVTITTATLSYRTYNLENGDTWLLPVWVLDGYVGSDTSQEFSDTELAVSSTYVKLPTNTGVIAY